MRFREIAEKCMHRLRETLSAVLGLTCICTAAAEGKVRGGEAYFSGGYPEETVADTLSP